MDAFECYQTFLALKLHFTRWDYDYFEFRGKTKTSVGALKRRKDRYWFDKLAFMQNQLNRMLAQFCETPNPFIRDIVVDDDTFFARQKRIEALAYHFKSELKILRPDFDSNFVVENGKHPFLFREYMGKRLSLESLTIIAHLTECIPYWKKNLGEDALSQTILMKIIKYHSFLNYNRQEFQKIMIDFVCDRMSETAK